jgi:hypothetical protein
MGGGGYGFRIDMFVGPCTGENNIAINWLSAHVTWESVWMLVSGARMFLRSHTFTVRSSEPDMICSERLNAAHVTASV